MKPEPREARSVRAIRFGAFAADLVSGELYKSGRKINMQDQPFQALALLLAHPGELVTREELEKRLWPGAAPLLGLNTAIKKVRESLGDDADSPRFVETLPGKGYRFICPVVEVVEDVSNTLSSFQTTNGSSVGSEQDGASLQPTSGTDTQETHSLGVQKPDAPHTEPMRLDGVRAADRWKNFQTRRLLIWLGCGIVTAMAAAFAWRQFRPAIEHDSVVISCLKGLSFLNDAYDMPDKNERAVEALEASVKFDPYYAAAYAGLGEAYFHRFAATQDARWAEKADAACKKSQQLDGASPTALNCVGTLHNGRGEYDDAVGDFSQALKSDPANAESYRGRAAAYQGRKTGSDLRAAEKDYLRAIEIAPDKWRSYAALASFYHNQGRDDEAIVQFKKAITVRPDNSEPMARLGAIYLEQGEYDEAITTLEKALRLFPSFAAYENLGTAYLDQHNFPKAIENFKRALEQKAAEKNADDYRGHGNLARAYFWTGEQGPAQEHYGKAIELAAQQLHVNPKDPEATLSLAIYYAMLGQRGNARIYIDQALALEPNTPETKFWAMIAEFQLGNKEKALAWLPEALRYSTPEVQAAPELDALRCDPQFRQIISKVLPQPASSCNTKP